MTVIAEVLELHCRRIPMPEIAAAFLTSYQATGPWGADQDADFRAQCVRCLPALRRYARILAPDRFTAEDLVQDTMLLALRSQHRFTPGTNLRAWLFTIMRNHRINGVRRAIREGAWIDLSEASEADAPDGGQEVNEEIRDMYRALARMPEDTRVVVLLAGYHQLSYGEIGDRLKIPIGTVRSRLARGRRLLRVFAAGEPTDVRGQLRRRSPITGTRAPSARRGRHPASP